MINKRTINLTVSIAGKDLSHKAVKSFETERNFSDVSNKFTMTIVDTPQTGLKDLELFMISGNRTISVSYTDTTNNPVCFKGQIWDYTSSFVGNIKELTVTGYLSRTVTYDTAGLALYNIDWNSYYNMRTNACKFWNVSSLIINASVHYNAWLDMNIKANKGDASKYTLRNSNIVYSDFRALLEDNSVTIKIKGRSGKSIDLPVPETFGVMMGKQVNPMDNDKVIYEGDDKDKEGKLWGYLKPFYYLIGKDDSSQEVLKPEVGALTPNKPPDGSTYDTFWFDGYHEDEGSSTDEDGNTTIKTYAKSYLSHKLRAFKRAGESTAYIQLNPDKEYFGSGTYIYSPLGVDPSSIVKKLCDLEGWKYTPSSIVQTDMVPCSDAFKMNNQSALQFITDVLVPVSITPVCDYWTTNNERVKQKTGTAGFTFYFDKNHIAHFEPLSDLYKEKSKDKTYIKLGYNIPDSPVIAFQVDTKGTCFYTVDNQKQNTLSIVTGTPIDTVETTQAESIAEYNKVKGHHEVMDKFFGYSYEEMQQKYEKQGSNLDSLSMYLGFGNDAKIYTDDGRDLTNIVKLGSLNGALSGAHYVDSNGNTINGDYSKVHIVSSDVQKRLVKNIYASGVQNSTMSLAEVRNARSKIEEFMITASLNLYADTRINPADIIHITNMVKSQDSDYSEVHPTTGDYLVLKQKDIVSGDQFIQQLSLIRSNARLKANINPQNIDYSRGMILNEDKVEAPPKKVDVMYGQNGYVVLTDEDGNVTILTPEEAAAQGYGGTMILGGAGNGGGGGGGGAF